jgi:hypothetical protein
MARDGEHFFMCFLAFCDGEKTASSTNIDGKNGYPSARN